MAAGSRQAWRPSSDHIPQDVAHSEDDLDALRAAVEEGRRKAEDPVARALASEEEARKAQGKLLDLKDLLVGRLRKSRSHGKVARLREELDALRERIEALGGG